jgi:hypothetical protein
MIPIYSTKLFHGRNEVVVFEISDSQLTSTVASIEPFLNLLALCDKQSVIPVV